MIPLRRILIVGNGIAGVTAADTLRAEGFTGEITLIGDEPHPAYSRPALSKSLLRDVADQDSHLLPPPLHGATEILGVRAQSLDLDSRIVLLADGTALEFDGLIISTGCRPMHLGSGDPEATRELTLRTLEDALALRHRIAQKPSMIVIGGGPLGMEVASAALEAGCSVTLISPTRPMLRQLGSCLSDMLITAGLKRGIRIVSSTAVGLDSSGECARVTLEDGSSLEAECVVSAIGDRPNIEWLESSGLLNDGLLIADERGQVAPGIAAAGDVATVMTPRGRRRMPLWNSAIEQSKRAATHLVNPEADLSDPLPYFWTEQFGIALKTVGHLPPHGEPVVLEGDPSSERVLLQWPDDGDRRGGVAAAVNVRIPIPKLRRLASPA